MREIKFRAWNKYHKKMFAVYEIAFDVEVACVTSAIKSAHSFGFTDLELMQYTGLKDKNGVDIYEGDILFEKSDSDRGRQKSPRRHSIVIWWLSSWRRECYNGQMIVKPNISVRPLEVIGNIYENPELIKEST